MITFPSVAPLFETVDRVDPNRWHLKFFISIAIYIFLPINIHLHATRKIPFYRFLQTETFYA